MTFLLSSSASIAFAQSNPVPLVDLPTHPVSAAPLGAATLEVNDDGGASPQTVALSDTGT
jgi:hypothetical protein